MSRLLNVLLLMTCCWLGIELISGFEDYTSNSFCTLDRETEDKCATYCYNVVKPLLGIVKACQGKDSRIADLERELATLRTELAVFKENQSRNKAFASIAADVVAIRQQVELLTNKNKVINVTGELKTKEVKQQVRKSKVPFSIIIQRNNGHGEFNRSWTEYRDFFGKWDGSFFLGMEKIHQLTTENRPVELGILLTFTDGRVNSISYDDFVVGDEASGYELMWLGNFYGNTKDALRRSEHQKFTTFDRDNDQHEYINCASQNGYGGWWYSACSDCNLNGALGSLYWNSEVLQKVEMFITI